MIKPFIEAERKAGVAGADTRYLLFQDNLDAQKQPEYIDYLKVRIARAIRGARGRARTHGVTRRSGRSTTTRCRPTRRNRCSQLTAACVDR